ncbi:MAG: dihydrolipoyllysine-residue succinyltransferase [Verrucomicrobiota bacterium]
MATAVTIPAVGESVSSGTIATWHKQDGENVAVGDILLTLETDKISQELEAEAEGILRIGIAEGEEVEIGAVVATIEEGTTTTAPPAAISEEAAAPESPAASRSGETIDVKIPAVGESISSGTIAAWHKQDGENVAVGDNLLTLETDKISQELEAEADGVLRIAVEAGEEVEIGSVVGKIQVGAAKASPKPDPTPAPQTPPPTPPVAEPKKESPAPAAKPPRPPAPLLVKSEERVTRTKMSQLRQKIASHLVNAQQTAAILTTFNECDMSAVMGLRKVLQEDFVERHGIKLGFMSFFVKAVVEGLKAEANINASLDGKEIVNYHYYDIGIAVGTPKGLVVPVLRDCDQKSFAEIEQNIIDLATKARQGKLAFEDLQGATFSITNGGIYGSLLSTPILSPPQSGILGMHSIQQRPIAQNGQVVIKPMMNLALSYDHRIVDGKEAVTFLIRVKDCIENPARLLVGA